MDASAGSRRDPGPGQKGGGQEGPIQAAGRAGAAGGRPEWQMVDDGGGSQRTADNVRQMLSKGTAFALLSCVGTPNNAAVIPLIEEAGVPYVAPFTGASSLRKASRNVFHVRDRKSVV